MFTTHARNYSVFAATSVKLATLCSARKRDVPSFAKYRDTAALDVAEFIGRIFCGHLRVALENKHTQETLTAGNIRLILIPTFVSMWHCTLHELSTHQRNRRDQN